MIATYFLTSCSKKTVYLLSYYTLSSNPAHHIYFDEENTPISSFCDIMKNNELPAYTNSQITINGSSVNINDIYSLNFGSSYGDVSSIGSYFMFGEKGGFSNLTSIDFSGLSSLSSVGGDWMNGCDGGFSKLSSINFSGLSSLSSVGGNWMKGGGEYNSFAEIKSITVGSVSWKEDFSTDSFCDSWPSSGTIYGSAASSWLKGGISSWTCKPSN